MTVSFFGRDSGLERRLRSTGRRLQQAREDLAVTDEQLVQLADESADASLRAIVSDDLTAGADSADAARHRDAMARHRGDLVETIARLEIQQDELLDELSARRGSRE